MTQLPVSTTSDEVHAHPRHTGRGWLDLVLALSAIFISVVSLFVAFEHGRAERQLVAANSWPFLQETATISSETGVHVAIVNQGIGPAKLELFQVLYDGRPVASMFDLLHLCCGLPEDQATQLRQLPADFTTFSLNHDVFRPGAEKSFIDLPHQAAGIALDRALTATFSHVTLRACYCSVFDECWMSDLRMLRPEPVSACPLSEPSFNDHILPG